MNHGIAIVLLTITIGRLVILENVRPDEIAHPLVRCIDVRQNRSHHLIFRDTKFMHQVSEVTPSALVHNQAVGVLPRRRVVALREIICCLLDDMPLLLKHWWTRFPWQLWSGTLLLSQIMQCSELHVELRRPARGFSVVID